MGLFNKFKSNMSGGLKVHLEAPSSVPSDQTIPVTVTLTSDSSQTVNAVRVEIKVQVREEGATFGSGQGVGIHESETTNQTVSKAENREPFTVGPGETKTLNFQLYLNSPSAGALGQMGNMGGALGGVLQTLATVATKFENVNYLYSVHAYADVQGHHLSPSDQQPIQILPPAGASQTSQIENLQGQSPTPIQSNSNQGPTPPTQNQ